MNPLAAHSRSSTAGVWRQLALNSVGTFGRRVTEMADLQDAIAHLEAGDWQAAHKIVQNDASVKGSWAHGIVHMMEGDMQNAGYWYRRAERDLPEAGALGDEIATLKHNL